jgi:hypothetical protein
MVRSSLEVHQGASREQLTVDDIRKIANKNEVKHPVFVRNDSCLTQDAIALYISYLSSFAVVLFSYLEIPENPK